jgi:hypothetical protein
LAGIWSADVLTTDVLRSYLLEMPKGHIFDLTYGQFAEIFPPGEPDPGAKAALRQFAQECGCDLSHNAAEARYELTRR